MPNTSSTLRRLLIGAAALGAVIGGGVTTAGAAVPAVGSPTGTAAHHVRVDPRNVKDPETSLEGSIQDHSGKSEPASTEAASKDTSLDATGPSSSNQAQASPGSPDSTKSGASESTAGSTGVPIAPTHPDTSQGSQVDSVG